MTKTTTSTRSTRSVRLLPFLVTGVAMFAAGSVVLAAGEVPGKPVAKAGMPESARVELGRRLFFDPAASRSGMRSCADCHDPEHGYSDQDALSADARGDTPRRSQTLVDCVDSPTMDWAGALKKIEDVVVQRVEPTAARPTRPSRPSGSQPYYKPQPPITPGPQFLSAKVPDSLIPTAEEQLRATRRYASAFVAAYGEAEPSTDRIVNAISAYCRSIRSGESAYDRYVEGDEGALSPAQKRGLELFRGKAGCASCHVMDGKRATFSDYAFHQTALPEAAPAPRIPKNLAADILKALAGGTSFGPLKPGDPVPEAIAAAALSTPPTGGTKGFKTPTLRDVADRGPFMHNGSLATLEDVVRHFSSGKPSNADADPLMPAYIASEAEVEDIVAFLHALTSDKRPGSARVAWSLRPTRTRLHFVDADGNPLAHWPVVLAPAGDAVPGGEYAALIRQTTDVNGWITYVPPPTTHVRVVLEGGLRPEGGCWIPDTCREAKVTIPIKGAPGRIRVTFDGDAPVPEVLELVHEGATYFPDRKTPRTVLRREGVIGTAEGRSVAVYAGMIRTDVPESAALKVPETLARGGRAATPIRLDPERTVSVHLEN